MTFVSAFLTTLLWRPHRAVAALYWLATKRRVRARNVLRIVAAHAPHFYPIWINEVERQNDAVSAAAAAIAGWKHEPRFTILLPLLHETDHALLLASIASLERQCFGEWRAIVVRGHETAVPPLGDPRITISTRTAGDDAAALAIGIDEAVGDYVVPVVTGAVLPPTALFRYAEAALAQDRPAVLFGDHDEINRRGWRARPWFKPEWNAEMFLAQDYISAACAIRTDFARAAGPVATALADVAVYALLLRVSKASAARIVRVPYVQCHTRRLPPDIQDARVLAVTDHLDGSGAIVSKGPFQSVKVQWPLPAVLPLVSVIVPTRDHAKLLRACVTGVLGATRYHDVEVLIVDNGSTDPATLRYLSVIALDPRVRILSYDHPYNYSAINNFAAAQARGDYLCLLNNDTEVLDAEWLTELMRYATMPHVGAVGAKLLYGDGTIQHAGVVIGLGEAAGHAHRYLKPDDPGYFRQAHIPQYVSAVTAACLVVEKRKFLAVGGLDAEGLHIAFNDVDFCLKLGEAGWRNVYAPQAVMLHHESKSRGKDRSPAHIERYKRELGILQSRWNTKNHLDPLHHPISTGIARPSWSSSSAKDDPLSLSEDLLPGVPLVESPLFEPSLDAMGLSEAERDIAVQLHTRGYAVLDFPDPDIHARIDRVRASLAPRYAIDVLDPLAVKAGSHRIQDAWTFDEDVKAIAACPELLALLSRLYGRRAFAFQTLNFPVGTQQHPHSDSIHFSSQPERFMCGVWLAMEDIDAEAGPLLYLPGTHRWPILSNAMIGRRGSRDRATVAQKPYERAWMAMVEAAGVRSETFLARKGQALIWAANLLHGGSPQHDPHRTRWSQVTHYFFEDCLYYTPSYSDEALGELDIRRHVVDIATGKPVPNTYLGERYGLNAAAERGGRRAAGPATWWKTLRNGLRPGG